MPSNVDCDSVDQVTDEPDAGLGTTKVAKAARLARISKLLRVARLQRALAKLNLNVRPQLH